MKRTLLLIVLTAIACLGFAQVANYTFGYTAGTYTPITGGTVLGECTVGGSGTTSLDNVTYPNVALPFSFPFNGRRYTQVTVNSNGYLVFGGTSAISESSQISNSAVADGIVVAFGKDNQGIVTAGSLGEIRYETIGAAPNRAFVIQWKNFRDYNASGDIQNFQIKLYETTRVIEFVYGTITAVNTETAQVGLRGTANTDFLTRTTTTAWNASTAGATNSATMAVSSTIVPASGTIYTFTPPAVSAAPNVATVVSPANAATNVFATATLNWADGGGWTDGFKLYYGTTDPAAYVGDLGYVTSYDPPGDMAYSTPQYWKVVPYNTFGENTTGTQWTFTTAGAPLSGVKTIDPAGSGENNYISFTAAINALNGAGVAAGGVTFNVANGTYAENPPAITVSGNATSPVIFQAAVGANPVVTPTGGTGTFGFKLTAADYVTFDNIDITGTNTLVYGYWLAVNGTDGATNNTIKNCTVTIPYGTVTNYGVYSLGVTGAPNSYLTVLNNTFATMYSAIYLTGSSTAGSEAQTINVQGNTITGVRNYGVYLYYAQNSTIQYNNIGFYSGGTTGYNGIYTYGTPSTVNVHHNTISGGYTSSNVYGIYNYYASGTFAYNTVTNIYNTGSSAYYAFYDNYGGTTVWTNNSAYGITNTGTASFYGMYPYYATNSTWSNNSLYNITITSGTLYAMYSNSTTTSKINNNTVYNLAGTGSIYGGYISGGTTNSFYSNKIYELKYNGTSSGIVYGIYSSSGTTNNIFNNMIYDLRATASTATAPQIRAIAIAGGTNANIWSNSVLLNASGNNTAFSTAALYVSSTTPTIDLKNNIFVNKSTSGATGKAVCFWKTSAGVATLSATSDKNIYYVGETPGTANMVGYFSTTAYPTLDEYKLMTVSKDMGSYYEDVPFVSPDSPYDLHIRDGNPTRVEGNAIVLTGDAAYDIDGDARDASTPDIGADEGLFTPVAGLPGLCTLLTPANEASNLNPNGLTVTWAAPTTGGTPTEYYVFVSETNNDLSDFFANAVSTSTTGLSFNMDTMPDMVLGFQNTYYWAVQAHNSSGDSDAEDPAFQIWSFTTSPQMTASNTLAIGNAWPEAPKNGTIAVNNLGDSELTFTATGSPEFSFGTLRYAIPANSTVNLPYTFTAPATTGAYTGSITLTETAPGASTINISVTANVTTDLTIGNGTTEYPLPVDPYFGYTYSQTIYYPSELSYPAGYRIEKIYYYYNGYETAEVTKQFKIYMGHTTNSAFATTSSWIPLSSLTEVYSADNIPQLAAGGYWMEFALSTPFIYDGVSNLVVAVDENFPSYDASEAFFYGTATTGVNRSIYNRSDSANPDPAAPPTGTLVAGYPNTKFFVGAIPTQPQIAVTPDAWNYGTVVINTTNDKVINIQNNGAGTLTINGITPTSDGMFTLTSLPTFPVNLTTGQSTSFTVRYLPTAAGSHTVALTIDDNLVDYVVNVQGACVDPRITSLPHTQNFDGVTAPAIPIGWTAYKGNAGQSAVTSTTYSNSAPNSFYLSNSSYSTVPLRLISPQVTVPMNSMKVFFYARSGSAGVPLKFGTISALDGTGVFTELASISLTATFTQYSVTLGAYAGTDQYLCFQHGNSSTYQSIYIDNVNIEQLVANDLAATALSGANMAIADTPLTYNVTVANNGTAEQSAYTVMLKDAGGATLATESITTPIATGATAVHTLNWTPTVAGIYNLLGVVSLAGDANSSNDQSDTLTVGIYPTGTFIPQIGNVASTTSHYYAPYNAFYKNSMSEVIYLAHEMQATSGTIQAVIYQNNFISDVTKPIKIWMKHTTESNVSSAFLPFDGYTLVYDGNIFCPAGVNAVVVNLNTPFAYTGGNLAVRMYSVWEDFWYSSSDVFYYTATPTYPNRVRYYQADQTAAFDPILLTDYSGSAFTGTAISNVPNTAFIMSPATPIASLDAPVVTITASGTNAQLDWAAVTNAFAYRVYTSDDPMNFDGATMTTVSTNTYTSPFAANAKKFYKVTAITYNHTDRNLVLNPAAAKGIDNSLLRTGKTERFYGNKNK